MIQQFFLIPEGFGLVSYRCSLWLALAMYEVGYTVFISSDSFWPSNLST